MALTETLPWDAARHLDRPEMIAAFVEAALEDGAPDAIAAALETLAAALGRPAPDAEAVAGLVALARAAGLRLAVAPAA